MPDSFGANVLNSDGQVMDTNDTFRYSTAFTVLSPSQAAAMGSQRLVPVTTFPSGSGRSFVRNAAFAVASAGQIGDVLMYGGEQATPVGGCCGGRRACFGGQEWGVECW